MILGSQIWQWEHYQTSAFDGPQQFAGMAEAKAVNFSVKALLIVKILLPEIWIDSLDRSTMTLKITSNG